MLELERIVMEALERQGWDVQKGDIGLLGVTSPDGEFYLVNIEEG